MTDGQTLFAVFALLYLVECLRLVPSTAWMAAGSGRSGWRVLRPWSRLHTAGGSPLLLSFLPPLQAHVPALPWLLVPQNDGLQVRLTDDQVVRLSWDQIRPRVEESTLHLDSATRLRLPSQALAELWCQRLVDWRDLPPEKRRSAFLKHARGTLDTPAAMKTADEAAQRTRALRINATLHFLWCFGVISIVYRRFGDGPAVLAAAGVLFLLQIIQSWLFLRGTRSIKALIPHRGWRALGIAFLPQITMRAADAVSLVGKDEPPHPLAWHGLVDEKEWLRHARHFWRKARYVPGWAQADTHPPEAEALQGFFRQHNIAEADYDPPPASQLPTCPRCGAEFQAGITSCKDCGGVELRSSAGPA
ncbi:MAG: hypothetical protein IAE77_15010 [Prosthecobacter sp.]|jgi:hypothetical protein|uniref:hypothetical protein n=1 Tax=Prosthecobacter sp. TaxID=1965333 RepID=UPI001A0EF127|nr:hypothetical protein [Prosthecobacter sp.]MBE2284767.1 hypothetical protein [Prosthecobacter sp.]